MTLKWRLAAIAFGALVLVGTAFAQDPGLTEQTTCPPIEVGPGSDPLGILQKQIADALPCAFSGTAYLSAGPTIYLAPLNGHTRSVAQAVIAASPLANGVVLKKGAQSNSRANEQGAAVEGQFGDRLDGVSINADGTITVTIFKDEVTDAEVIAASHVVGYQAEPIIDHVSWRPTPVSQGG